MYKNIYIISTVYHVYNVDIYDSHGLFKIEFNAFGLNCIII